MLTLKMTMSFSPSSSLMWKDSVHKEKPGINRENFFFWFTFLFSSFWTNILPNHGSSWKINFDGCINFISFIRSFSGCASNSRLIIFQPLFLSFNPLSLSLVSLLSCSTTGYADGSKCIVRILYCTSLLLITINLFFILLFIIFPLSLAHDLSNNRFIGRRSYLRYRS